MRYLCPKHAELIRRNPETAMALWQGAMESGSRAIQRQDWAAARNFCGTAYDTALLQLWGRPANAAAQQGAANDAVKPSPEPGELAKSQNNARINPPLNTSDRFDVSHLVDAGTLLGHVLGQLGMAEEAQICLLTLQVNLLQGETLTRGRQGLALTITQDYVQQLVATAGIEDRLQHSRAFRRDIRVRHAEVERALH